LLRRLNLPVSSDCTRLSAGHSTPNRSNNPRLLLQTITLTTTVDEYNWQFIVDNRPSTK
jgi:hypothetical protein